MRRYKKLTLPLFRLSIDIFATTILLLVPAVAIAPAAAFSQSNPSNRPWMRRSLTPEQRADLLLQAMTLDEKITMVHGVDPRPIPGYVGFVPGNTRLGIPALRLADGRAGVGNGAKDVTLLPAPIAATSSWDTGLLHKFGEVLGSEEWGKGTNVALAPSIDVVRVPEWGRTFESYGEDPYFNGQMAIAEIHGIQSQGPIADANMYLTMNQENNRFKEDSIVDRRTLHEIYLPPFAAAIEDGHVGTVMCAYVKTDGIYSCENPYLLATLLRKQLTFEGWVMSDWGATHSTVPSANAGLDQEMPGAKYYGVALKAAIANGQVSMGTLDEHVRRILVTMFRFGLFDRQQTGTWNSYVRTPEHAAFSLKAAEQGTVLLKNEDGLLPLSDNESIAVIGAAGGAKPKASGGGSSGMIAPYIISPTDGIGKRLTGHAQVSYAGGSDRAKAAEVAKAAKVAIVFVNTDDSEGRDRPNLELPDHQDELVEAVAAANPKTIVVLNTGGPVLMPWIGKISGLIEAWYPGQEDGNAIAAILYGDVNPSGKLPLTFPRTAAEIPTSTTAQWPGVNGTSTYSEKLDVGYRWYDAHHVQPLFPFGFGLSYTTFKLSDLQVTYTTGQFFALGGTPKKISGVSSGGVVRVTLNVKNTGKRDGAEVIQVYVEQPKKNGEPPRQLRAFTKVELKAAESQSVHLELSPRSFSIYDPGMHEWKMPAGEYKILVGTSSRDLPLQRDIAVTDNRTQR
ncbi:MAG TPA: glycoside hydrolase family 3 C-terminal domain-containing protein [Acidobacteriaceae bacterium]|nr:glycoside hydrolase family 3 C-terminal domain-containing protein [Acidobacteriaceae bacterium]